MISFMCVQCEDAVVPEAIKTSCLSARIDAKLCPKDPDIIAFIHSDDLWVTSLKTDQECRLTFAHKGIYQILLLFFSAGVPTFVIQELTTTPSNITHNSWELATIYSNITHNTLLSISGVEQMINDPISAGVPSFVIQEEFDRFTGYWWEPRSKDGTLVDNKYRILYEEIDEDDVEILKLFGPLSEQGQGVDDFRYPRAGNV